VALSDLQNMQNYMRETLDRGLADLQAHQGGLSTPPQSALALAAPAAFSAVAPPPDQTVAAQINQQWQQGTREEQDTVGQAPPPAAAAPPAAAPPTITPGLTIDQVVTIKGQPTSIVDLGAKKIYVYQDLKIIFDNGKVADAN
jgi:hypothetical protein